MSCDNVSNALLFWRPRKGELATSRVKGERDVQAPREIQQVERRVVLAVGEAVEDFPVLHVLDNPKVDCGRQLNNRLVVGTDGRLDDQGTAVLDQLDVVAGRKRNTTSAFALLTRSKLNVLLMSSNSAFQTFGAVANLSQVFLEN